MSLVNSYENINFNKMHLIKSPLVNDKVLFFGDIYSNYTEMISDIILYVLIILNILTILFFTIVKDVEKQIIKDQVNNILDDIFDKNYNQENFGFLKNFNNSFKQKIKEINIDEETEKSVKDNNTKVFIYSMIVLGIVNIFSIVILFLLWKNNKFDFIYYLRKNILLGTIALCTEVLFLYTITSIYIYVDKKYILQESLKMIRK